MLHSLLTHYTLCYTHYFLSVCGACKKPIEGRAVSAINKKWHPEHFVCAHCERPFAGERFYEHSGETNSASGGGV